MLQKHDTGLEGQDFITIKVLYCSKSAQFFNSINAIWNFIR